MNGLPELRVAGLLYSRLTMWFFRAVAYSLNLSILIHVQSNEIYAPLTLASCFVVFCNKILLFGEQGWRSGESTRLPPVWPGSTPGPGDICGLSLLLVLVLAPRGFSPGTPDFPSPQKPTLPNSN